MDIPLIFAFVAVFGVTVYVLADGFDLGVGILFLFAPRESDRDLMMASIEPVWDGNETWLVFGGTFLFAAFPAAYYILLPAFYLPIILMLFALIFRGIAFSFRGQAGRSRRIWDFAFAGGSLAAVFAQGLVLGGFIDGVDVQSGMFHGGPFSFLSFLGILCGLGLIGGYALMGAGWLIWKTDGPTQVFAREIGHAALILTAAMLAVVSAWTALSDPEVADRWFAWPNIAWLAPIPLISVAALVAAWRALRSGPEFAIIHAVDFDFSSRLFWPCREPLALHRATAHHDLERRSRPTDLMVRRNRTVLPSAHRVGVPVSRLLGVSRQDSHRSECR